MNHLNFDKIFKDFSTHLGLNVFQVEAVKSHDIMRPSGYVHTLHLLKDFNSFESFADLHTELLVPISTSILNSPAVTEKINEVVEKLDAAEMKVLKLESEIERLKKYEAHFQLEMRLRHGDGPK